MRHWTLRTRLMLWSAVFFAAAVALRRAGDPAGADVLLKAMEDPVEGPEVRWALTKLAGDDRGDTAGAWEEFVRAGGAK